MKERFASIAALALLTACGSADEVTGRIAPQVAESRKAEHEGSHSPVDWCSGADEDGDGFVDEDYRCVRGTVESCVTPCFSWGLHTCSEACTWGDCRPSGEVCNGLDDDCDGEADEDFGCIQNVVEMCDAGGRAHGASACDDACVPTPCAALGREVCNGEDDDGDGRADEDFACRWGDREVCDPVTGTDRVCSTICTWSECGRTEVCNHLDDDRDGKTDEGFGYRLVQPPIDMPRLELEGETLLDGAVMDCSEDDVIILLAYGTQDDVAGDHGTRNFLVRMHLDGTPVHQPLQLCAIGGDIDAAGDALPGSARFWGDRTIATCFERSGFESPYSVFHIVDSSGGVVLRDVAPTGYTSMGVFNAGNRAVWPRWHWEEDGYRLDLRVYDDDGRVVQDGLETDIFGISSFSLVGMTHDEVGDALYFESWSNFAPGRAIFRRYYDLDSGTILREQELIPGRGGFENVVDGPGATLIVNNGLVKAVFDDDGRMVGNKLFFDQGPNIFFSQVGRFVGEAFYLPYGPGGQRFTVDGRESGFFQFPMESDPEIPEAILDFRLSARNSGCITPSGRHIALLVASADPDEGRPEPFARMYVSDCE